MKKVGKIIYTAAQMLWPKNQIKAYLKKKKKSMYIYFKLSFWELLHGASHLLYMWPSILSGPEPLKLSI